MIENKLMLKIDTTVINIGDLVFNRYSSIYIISSSFKYSNIGLSIRVPSRPVDTLFKLKQELMKINIAIPNNI
jgi:hypothetical protein